MSDQTVYQKAVAIRCRALVEPHLDAIHKLAPLAPDLRQRLTDQFARLLFELYSGASTFAPNKTQLAEARGDHLPVLGVNARQE